MVFLGSPFSIEVRYDGFESADLLHGHVQGCTTDLCNVLYRFAMTVLKVLTSYKGMYKVVLLTYVMYYTGSL